MSGNRLDFEEPMKDAISRVRFAPESNNLLISSWDSSIRLVDVNSSKLRLEVQTEAALLDCCFQNESIALSAASDGSIFRYDLRFGAHSTIGKHEDSATCIEYSPETSQVITAGWDGRVLSWDSRSTKASHPSSSFNLNVDSFSLSGIELLASTGSSLRRYDLRKLDETIQGENLSMGFRIRCVRPMACQKGFAVGSVDGHVTLQSNSDETGYTFRCISKSKKGKSHPVTVNDIAFNPSLPGAFVTGDYEGHVIAWDGSSRKRLLELPRYPNSVASLSYNSTGELLAIASSYTYQEANEIEDHPQIFIQELGESNLKSAATGSSCRR
ncbi:mitotic checkpoint protein BUB3.3 isoform X2 [Amaranthus tricolor]|uniref:mitotic checkpoint protein BUB3.3 isoform X2 n=1 Tax=Amaranthus tricolor TaxID=29722 RepID=UPI002582CD3A|nr:mitotic checkpoint protein BUB3.3 isoform X2 [Amaranthus tricolor]